MLYGGVFFSASDSDRQRESKKNGDMEMKAKPKMKRGQPVSNLEHLLRATDPNTQHILWHHLQRTQETLKAKRQIAGRPMIYVCERIEMGLEV